MQLKMTNIPLEHSLNYVLILGIAQSITFLMDSSEEIARSLASESRYCADSKIILFPNMTKQGQYKGVR